MNNDTIQFKESDAWMFLAISGAAAEKFAPLKDVIGVADAINHAIPTDREIEGGFTRLLQAGLIGLEGRVIGLTPAGITLIKRCNSKSEYWLEQWDFLAEILKTESFPKISNITYLLEPGEKEQAYKAYKSWFNYTLKNIEADEASGQDD